MPVNKEKQSARWLRNKRAERLRKMPQPTRLDVRFEQRAREERDRRAAQAHRGAWCWAEERYLFGDRLHRAINLAADVWLAVTLHEVQHGCGTATTARICRWLEAQGRANGYTSGSLRKFVPKARERVRLLETRGDPWRPDQPCWRAFEPDLEH